MEHGTVVYRYTVKNGKFNVREGVVNCAGFRNLVNFTDGGPAYRCPRKEDLGKIRSVGHSLWLNKKDDNLARQVFIDYELDKIDKLRKQIARKCAVIDMLSEGMEDTQ